MQPSAIRTLSPSLRLSTAAAPSASFFKLPLCLAKRIENDVSGISSGTNAATSLNACESVITILTLSPSLSNTPLSPGTCVTTATAPLSSKSLITCCCGIISLPFGAEESMGVTRTAISFSLARSPVISSFAEGSGTNKAIASFNSSIPVFSIVLISLTGIPGFLEAIIPRISSVFSKSRRSVWLSTIIYGSFFSSISDTSCSSSGAMPYLLFKSRHVREDISATTSAISVLSRTLRVFPTLFAPSSP